jgi:hypothetical protein
LETVFSVGFAPRLYNKDHTPAELMMMKHCASEYNRATLFLGDIYSDLALQVGGISNLRQ